jgi:hypothetical protein
MPRFPSAIAMARPIPLPAPVTRAVAPASELLLLRVRDIRVPP